MSQILGVTRPNFLTLTLVCVLLASAVALQQNGGMLLSDLLVVTLLALAAHASVNAFNEYFDYQSGLDFKTQRTPFSGGSGTLVAAPHLANATLGIAILTLLVTIFAGLWLVWSHSFHLIWLGAVGVLVIYSYTQYLNRSPLLCLLAPGIGFGMCMTLGASWVLTGHLTAGAWLSALVTTLLVSNLLLLNQFPDIEPDRAIGRRHLPIVWGPARSARLFAGLYAAAYVIIAVAVIAGWVTPWLLLVGLSLGLTVPLVQRVVRAPEQVAEQVTLLGLNVAVTHIVPLLMAVGFAIDWWLGG